MSDLRGSSEVGTPIETADEGGDAVTSAVEDESRSAEEGIAYGLADSLWTEDHWKEMLIRLVEAQAVVTWQQVTSLVLGKLNPPQVGTSMASAKGFQAHYNTTGRDTMRVVRNWLYDQSIPPAEPPGFVAARDPNAERATGAMLSSVSLTSSVE